jgi:hypothetical protein
MLSMWKILTLENISLWKNDIIWNNIPFDILSGVLNKSG